MISVIMPVYNAESYVKQSIDSILKQTDEDFELIIVNDGSIDNSESIILNYNDKRIKYFYQNNQGAASARNRGLDMAKGEYIVFQDADDISLPNRFEILKRHFISSNIGIVHSDMLAINEFNSPIGYWQSRSMEKQRVLRFFLKVGTFINGASMMLRREVFNNLRYDTSLKIGEDTNLILQILKEWDSVHVPEPLYFYRKHKSNTTRESEYSILAKHVQKFIENEKIEDLIPEVEWNEEFNRLNKSKAYAILSLFLFRRGLHQDGQKWYEEALKSGLGSEVEEFILAIGHMVTGKFEEALNHLYSCKHKDHIVENYIGEVLTLLQEESLAYHHFVKSISINPNYVEAIDNLRALGGKQAYNLLDITWAKFNKVS